MGPRTNSNTELGENIDPRELSGRKLRILSPELPRLRADNAWLLPGESGSRPAWSFASGVSKSVAPAPSDGHPVAGNPIRVPTMRTKMLALRILVTRVRSSKLWPILIGPSRNERPVGGPANRRLYASLCDYLF